MSEKPVKRSAAGCSTGRPALTIVPTRSPSATRPLDPELFDEPFDPAGCRLGCLVLIGCVAVEVALAWWLLS